MNKIVAKNKNSDKKKRKKNGFTLVELLAVLGILSIILLIGVPVFLNLQDSVLKSEKENIISYIETRAADYANDTSITVVSVEDLIKEGYVEPDDETDIYDPVTNESFNCYIVTSVFE
ncbi:MAG TPA: prepilin-type N-terminal cleavage/methylation domain-containing protein, partial [Candidatus Onthocola stercoravium]|nr:prepilin-type N-terminal cleavage/methylation domain-containing protein [Candidatus Onthocola stercoravium]